MATTSNPYGLRPLNKVGGTAYAGATTQLPIASGYATGIFYGDIVAVVAGGTIEKMGAVGTNACLLYTSPSPRDGLLSRMPSSA